MRRRALTLLFAMAMAGCADTGLSRHPGDATSSSSTGSSGSSSGSSSTGSTGGATSGTGSTSGTSAASTGSTTGSSSSSGTTGVAPGSITVIAGFQQLSAYTELDDFAFDANGTLYATDRGDNAIIKFNGATGSLWAGRGTQFASGDDGQGTSASFAGPWGIVWSGTRLLVADQGDSNSFAQLRAIDLSANVSTVCGAGQFDSSTSGPCSLAKFAQPGGMAIDAQGNLYVADTGGSVSKVTADLQTVSVIAATPDVTTPLAVAVDAAGNVYIADYGVQQVRVRWASGGVVDWVSLPVGFTGAAQPTGVAVDAAGNVYASDPTNGRILRWDANRNLTGTAQLDATNYSPVGLKVVNGKLYAADSKQLQIYRVDFAW